MSLACGEFPIPLQWRGSEFGFWQEGAHFRGSASNIIPGFMAQGGDITHGDGTGGQSIYGRTFKDENFKMKHNQPGLLSMANSGRDTNGSQFFITFKATPHLDGKHTCFGRVVGGEAIMKVLENCAIDKKTDRPKKPVIISGCGEVAEEEEIDIDGVGEEEAAPVAKKASEKTKAEKEGKQKEPQGEANSNLSPMAKRLMALRMKMSQSRQANKLEVEHEYRRQKDPNYDKRQMKAENKLKALKKGEVSVRAEGEGRGARADHRRGRGGKGEGGGQ